MIGSIKKFRLKETPLKTLNTNKKNKKMKIKENTMVFGLVQRGQQKIRLHNPNEELSVIIDKLFDASNGFVNLYYVLGLEFSKKSIKRLFEEQEVQVNLYENKKHQMTIIEIEGDKNNGIELIMDSNWLF